MQIVVLKCGFFAAISITVRSPPRICPWAPIFPWVATCDAGISNGSKMIVFADDILQNQSDSSSFLDSIEYVYQLNVSQNNGQ